MEQAARQDEGWDVEKTSRSPLHWLKYGFWSIGVLLLLSSTVFLGGYFFSMKRVIGFRKVYEPAPSIYYHMVPYVVSPIFPEDHHPVLNRLYRHMYEIDRRWIRPKWWTKPDLTPQEQAAAGVTLGVPLK